MVGGRTPITVINQTRANLIRLRATNDELDVLHARAESMNVSLSEYLRWRGLKPIGQLKSPRVEKGLAESKFVAYIGLTRELNKQGINLNQLTRTLNWAKNNSQSVEGSVVELAKIRQSIKEIADSIKHLGVDP